MPPRLNNDVKVKFTKLDPEDAILELSKMFHQFEDRALALEFVLRMAWNGGVADQRLIELPPL